MQENINRSDYDDNRKIFTAYLLVALKHRRGEILLTRSSILKNEVVLDLSESAGVYGWGYSATEDGINQCISNLAFEGAFVRLKGREQRILMDRGYYGRKYEDIGAELGMKYKAVAAIYRRALMKIKAETE
ncbi:MAG: sigma-70 family RNA polymerase sigma factor [Oscillospiraceae bacterium]|nr:sigma-70 family RNA polymerase sigma factor [Oscillospiraceae bacterium]